MPDREFACHAFSEISLHILDAAFNSIDAGATLISISVAEDESSVCFVISDNGCGMPPEILEKAALPRFSTKKSAGLGLYLLKTAAESAGGCFSLSSRDRLHFPDEHGTVTSASFKKGTLPLGSLSETVMTLIQAAPSVDFLVTCTSPLPCVNLDTRKLREILGDVPLNSPGVLRWIKESLTP